MPAYKTPAVNRSIPQAVPGLPAYLLGSLNRLVAPTRMKITTGSLTTNVATLTVTVIEGNAPVVGQLVTVIGCSNANYNVTDIALTGSTAVNAPDDGTYTLTYAKTHADIVAAALTGAAVTPQAEVGEALANGSSLQLAIQSNIGPENGRTMRFDVSFPSLPTTAQVDVQTAAIDVDSEYQTLGTVSTVAGGVASGSSLIQPYIIAPFVRFKVTNVAGGSSPTVVAKVTV